MNYLLPLLLFQIITFTTAQPATYITFEFEPWWHCIVPYIQLNHEYAKGSDKIIYTVNTTHPDIIHIKEYKDKDKKWGDLKVDESAKKIDYRPNGHEGRICGGDCNGEDLTNSIPVIFTYDKDEKYANKDNITHCWHFWRDGQLVNHKIEIPEGPMVYKNQGVYVKPAGDDSKHWDEKDRNGRNTIITERIIGESERMNYNYYVSVLNKTKPATANTAKK